MNAHFFDPKPRPIRLVARSAFRAGGLAHVFLRSSVHSFTWAALDCSFSRALSALHFALIWAERLGVAVPVRRVGSSWSVSVPVQLRSSHWPVGSGLLVITTGGLCRFISALRSAGFWTV